MDVFNEDDLYKNLDWLSNKQKSIEDRLYKNTYPDKSPELFLYDVTSSYLEGSCNELGAFGYNRDGKKGKQQIVIGLLCDDFGKPLSIEVFQGNTNDTKTFHSQIKKVAKRFGDREVTFVGDRGMIKGPQIEEIKKNDFHYITAITKDQINKLLNQGIIQLELFDEKLAEIVNEDVRYVLRRNPQRAEEIRKARNSKLLSLKRLAEKQNKYLLDHPKAHEDVALRKVEERCKKLNIFKWAMCTVFDRKISIETDEDILAEESKLDGCYVLKTDLKNNISKNIIHNRYKDLAKVEWAFRTSKTVELEMRPIHVRLKDRTRGHALVVMLAYRIVQELSTRWANINLTVDEGLRELAQVCAVEMKVKGKPFCKKIPEPRSSINELLQAAQVRLPEALPSTGKKVATRKKLPERRKLPKKSIG